ncbi:uncharacterized protein LOC131942599 [Physella acuta]|uniref:uncharacterized protein LOC131942599 n=1 Tax=Physella acuta TaxID=109671 RepID=UPI0027DCADB5|nr:uncharacterized protein LOC131942599 [Physella acuta]
MSTHRHPYSLYWCGLVFFVLGLSLMTAGVGTNYWMLNPVPPESQGLFMYCDNKENVCNVMSENEQRSVVQGLEITGALVGTVAAFMSIIYFLRFPQAVPTTFKVPNLVWLFSSIGGLLGVVGAGYYAINIYIPLKINTAQHFNIQLGYSFGLALSGSIILLMSGAFIRVGAAKMIKVVLSGRRNNTSRPPGVATVSENFAYDPDSFAPPLYHTVCPPSYYDTKHLPPPPSYDELVQGTQPPPAYGQVDYLELHPLSSYPKTEQ